MVAEGPSVSDEGGEALAKQRLKLAMMTYDETLFRGTMQECVDRLTFDGAVLSVALPFLAEVGVLWLTDTICPAHEHFMSNLLRQMLFAEIHNAPVPEGQEKGKVIVLYLPEREIHDISLLFLHHLCRSAGRQSVFLGQSVPFDDLVNVAAQFEDVCFVSYCTTSPAADQAQDYVDRIDRTFAGSDVTFPPRRWGVQTGGWRRQHHRARRRGEPCAKDFALIHLFWSTFNTLVFRIS